MASPSLPFPFLLFLFLSLFLTPTLSKKSVYIVHMAQSHKPTTFSSTHDWYSSILHSLSSTSTSAEARPDLIYTYSHAATGFAAHITAAHAAELRGHPSVLSVVPDQIVKAATTETPNFLGLSDQSGLWPETDYGSNIVVGVIDSGIWPENPSFHDLGLGNVPSSWNGSCVEGPDFNSNSCNKKVIGARFYYKGYEKKHGELKDIKSARDTIGHGSHCASIAAGSAVRNAGLNQLAQGEARGVAPKARIAVYKVLWSGNKGAAIDVLAAMDDAIRDGVDLISLSIYSGFFAVDYYLDYLAIASFRATQNGVLVTACSGNQGPWHTIIDNVAPWMLTVGSSTLNREFVADVVLGDGRTFKGSSLYPDNRSPLTVSSTVVRGYGCWPGSLDPSIVKGKVVLCSGAGVESSAAIQEAGGVGMITISSVDGPFFIPTIRVDWDVGFEIETYMSSTNNPTAILVFRGTIISSSPSAPRVAERSSRGPSLITREILKPDVIAPGVNILAAWTGAVGPSGLEMDPRRVHYNIQSGTSMATPHVSGLVAMLKKANPDWSPAAIKSAIMTTAYDVDNSGMNIIDTYTGNAANPFDYGSGHISPSKALDPGLVYDMDNNDYIAFLCSIGYNSTTISLFVQDQAMIDCRSNNLSRPGDLNYPSFSVFFKSRNDPVVTYTRVVKNVGSSTNAVYHASVDAPPNVVVSVSPPILVFNAATKTQSYTISFDPTADYDLKNPSFGSIVWSDGTHIVRSPIAVHSPEHFQSEAPQLSVASL